MSHKTEIMTAAGGGDGQAGSISAVFSNGPDVMALTRVPDQNRDREGDAKALNRGADAVLWVKALSLAIPGCGAIGNFLVLNNPPENLTVAST